MNPQQPTHTGNTNTNSNNTGIIGKDNFKIIIKKLNQQIYNEFFDSACEIGSLMISACFNSIVRGENSGIDSNISPYQSSWNFSSPDYCVDTLANVVLVAFTENCKISSPQEETELLQIFVDLIVSYSRALLGNNQYVRAKVCLR